MLKICNIDMARVAETAERLEKYEADIVKKLCPSKIILFGSFARGDFNEGSDIDLAVIGDWRESFLDRIKVLLEMNKYHLPVEPIGYTEQEFKTMQEDGNPFILEMIETGKVVYEERSARDGAGCG